MADILSAATTVEISSTRTVGMDKASQTWTPTNTRQRTWANGTGSSQAEDHFCVTRSITAGAFENLDLTNLTQDDDDGDTVRTVTFTQIKAIYIYNSTSAGGYLIVGGGTDTAGAGDAWTGTAGQGWLVDDSDLIHIANGDCIYLEFGAGVSVTNATNDVLGLGGVTETQTYTIHLIGDTT